MSLPTSEPNSNSPSDNAPSEGGGSIAIKGFNYQKAVISYIAILNYRKANFQILVENQDDAEVLIEDKKTFIQVKSEKLSISKICKQDTKSRKSILSKLIDKTCPGAFYKIFTTNKFNESDKRNLEKVCGQIVSCDVFKCSKKQTNRLLASLQNDTCNIDEMNKKLERLFLAISPFEDKYEAAIPFLLGAMAEEKISIDGNRGKTALNELFTQIDIKSELDPLKSQSTIHKKQISKDDLDLILINVDKEELRKDLHKELLEECNFPKTLKYSIRRELFNLYTTHKSLKNTLRDVLGDFKLSDGGEAYQIKSLYHNVGTKHGEGSALYAVIIDIVTDKILESSRDH